MLRGRAKGARPFSLPLALLAAADEVIERASRCRPLAFFRHGAMSGLSPLCDQKRSLASASFDALRLALYSAAFIAISVVRRNKFQRLADRVGRVT
jgi:hypothetical protein